MHFPIILTLIPISISPTNAVQYPSSLQFRVTVRDFMQCGCAPNASVIQQAWNTPSVVFTTGKLDYCPITNDVIAGRYMGHPDFEADGGVYQPGTASDPTVDPFGILASPPYGGTLPTSTALTPIIEPYLDFYDDGIPKPRYCNYTIRNPASLRNNPRCGWQSTGGKPDTTGKYYFDMWYRDTPTYNKRVGYILSVNLKAGTTNTYDTSQFPTEQSNASLPGYGRGFHPLDDVLPCSFINSTTAANNFTLDCSNGGRIFPRARLSTAFDERPTGANHTFSFTSEIHETFQYTGTEVLQFMGDDDVWIFINEILAADLGGLHSRDGLTIDLSNAKVRAYLNLTINQTYAFDAYHAERHTTGSNFLLTTTLVPGCTVQDSAKTSYEWTPATLAQDWKLIGGPTWGIVTTNNELLLSSETAYNSVGYAFLLQQQNVAAGFLLTFSFRATAGAGEGFVFTLTRDSIVNPNGGSGGNLGFKNNNGSIALVFDWCSNRSPAAATSCAPQIRLHYAADSSLPNSAVSPLTRVRMASLYHPNQFNDGQTHTVMIRYHGPRVLPWLDVFVDDDLFLQTRSFDIVNILGGTAATLGFTTSTGSTRASTLIISDFHVNTVAIADNKTSPVNWPTQRINSTSNGHATIQNWQIRQFDICGGDIGFGGFGRFAHAVLVRRSLADVMAEEGVNLTASPTAFSGMTFINGTNVTTLPDDNVPYNITGTVVDLLNGRYEFSFTSTKYGYYSLTVWYGVACFDNTGQVLTSPPTECWMANQTDAAFFDILTPSPTPAPSDLVSHPVADNSSLVAAGIAIGVISFCGIMAIIAGVRFRNKWRKDKAFIEAGRIAAAERGVGYLGDNELDKLQNDLQRVMMEIQRERAKDYSQVDQQAEIERLLRSKGELQEQVRLLKMRVTGTDPGYEGESEGFMRKARKSFAARRTSRAPSAIPPTFMDVGGGAGSRPTSSLGGGLLSRARKSIVGGGKNNNKNQRTAVQEATAGGGSGPTLETANPSFVPTVPPPLPTPLTTRSSSPRHTSSLAWKELYDQEEDRTYYMNATTGEKLTEKEYRVRTSNLKAFESKLNKQTTDMSNV